MDNGFRKIDGGDRGGDPPAAPFGRALLTFRAQRQRAANDNRAPLGRRLLQYVVFAAAGLFLTALAWMTMR